MITFSPDFFNEEYRDGYLVSEMRKRAWDFVGNCTT